MKNKGYILTLSTALISGLAIFINKFGVSVINPDIFTFLKNLTVAVMLTALIIAARDRLEIKQLSKKQWGQLLAIGLLGGSIPFILFFKGLKLSSGAGAAFVHKTMFIWIFLLAGYFLKEKISLKLISAGLIMLIANAMLLKFSAIKINAVALSLLILATLFWAIENTVSKHAIKSLKPKLVMWGRMFFGAFFIFIYLAATGQSALLASLSQQQIGWTIITAIILLAYVGTWYTGIKHIPLSKAAVILMLGSPITTVLNGIYNQTFATNQYIALGLALLALTLVAPKDILSKIYSKSYERN